MHTVELVRHARRHARLSQRALAARAGVSQSRLARIETGEVDPPLGLLTRLIGLCGLRLSTQLALAVGSSRDVLAEAEVAWDAAAAQAWETARAEGGEPEGREPEGGEPEGGEPETAPAETAEAAVGARAGRLVGYLRRGLIERFVATLADRERDGRPLAGVASVELRRGLVQLGSFQPTVVLLGAVAASCWDPDPPRVGGGEQGGEPLILCPRPGGATDELLRLLAAAATEPIEPTRLRRRFGGCGRVEVSTRFGRLRLDQRPAGTGGFTDLARAAARLPTDGGRLGSCAHLLVATPEQLARAGQLPAGRADEIVAAREAVEPRDRSNRRQPPHRDVNEHRRWQDSFAPAAIAAALVRSGRLDWRADRPGPRLDQHP